MSARGQQPCATDCSTVQGLAFIRWPVPHLVLYLGPPTSKFSYSMYTLASRSRTTSQETGMSSLSGPRLHSRAHTMDHGVFIHPSVDMTNARACHRPRKHF